VSPAAIEDAGHLASELDTLPAETRDLLARHHFDVRLFLSLASRLRRGALPDNRVEGEVSPPAEGDLASLPARGTVEWARLEGIGREALRTGRVALVVLAGGMATRMGGVVKALVEVLPGRTFLDVRLAEQDAVERRTGARPPVWLMTSHATDVAIRTALAGRPDAHGMRTFPQRLSLRLTPEGGLFRDTAGHPSIYSPGHGDVLDALRDSGLLSNFVRAGGGTVAVTNLDNLGATLDEAIVGFHLSSGAPITSEVVDRYDADRGGLVVRHRGRQTILEELRLPLAFDVQLAPVFNVNTFYFDAAALLDLHPDWTYFAVKKKVDGAEVIQFERILNEIADWLPTRFLRVARAGEEARFLPVKDHAELLAHRGYIEAVMRARGILT
jgi:UTP--glucose-1-phosphate uridylyltransferase